MRIFILLITIISTILASNVQKLRAQILSTIAHTLVNKKVVSVCVDDSTFDGIQKYVGSLKFVSCDRADIIFTSKNRDIDTEHKTALIFSTSYYLYEHSPKIIGAFFWQKGRPNIILRRERLDSLGIIVPQEFKKYIE